MERILNGAPGTMSCWKRFGTMTASAFSETPFDRKPPLTKNYSQNSLWSPKAFEKTTALRVLFFSSQRKTIGKKVGDVQAFVAAVSSSLRKGQGIEPKTVTGVSPGTKPHQANPFDRFRRFESDNFSWE